MIARYKNVLEVANTFKNSQGFYSRLYESLLEFTESQKKELNKILKQNNIQNDSLSIILFLES